MDKKLKRALIYSALGAPGIGHWMMGQRAKGAALITASLALVAVFIYRLVHVMVAMFDALNADLYEAASGGLGPTAVRSVQSRIYLDLWWVILLLLALYGYGIFDLYRLRKR
jgi:hypothetical protein